ncbi:DUF3500 domain-containing protein [Rhodococcus sp. IEGM 1409]|uniref:DUF3500 domain-containing protein n=1 Tax=Rhodococcus sp. IEGM 1409 TaxID=3047082 RepID=UPI0024B6B540|nr:DUF3500 domain-containing protein [Rhodococcus sp. IEGM 1409]MDI9903709.1 DUF3500 domain-containing protein [Rhodococcus sp. IEGM 1409]
MKNSGIRAAAGLVGAVALLVTACSSSESTSDSPTTSSVGGSTTSSTAGGPSSGGPGGGMQEVTAVNLNTDGASPGGANTAEVVTAATAFLTSLDDSQREVVEYDFSDNKSRQTWSNFPATTVARPGIALADLSDDQRAALTTLLGTALSEQGTNQNTDIGKADDYLNSLGGQGADGFGALNDYFVAVYGEPSPTQPFMVQFGGHHLARTLTYNGDNVSQTPQFVGSEPVTFETDGVTVEPVKAESDGMFGAIAALNDGQLSSAEITSGTFDDLVAGPGADSGIFPAAEGVEVSTLDTTQKDAVLAAIKAYVNDLDSAAADKAMAKYESELDQTRIGWSNNTGPTEENSYIRIDGPSVWIEFINTRSQSTPDIHFHSVYRDKTNDYGSTTPS